MNAGTRRLTPGIVFLAIALVGSLLFVAYAVNVRDASQIPLLAAGGAAVGIAFIALASNDLRRNSIILQSELADELPVVTRDRIQLQQVILNLLRNASDAMADVQDRPRQLLIKTERDEHGDNARLTVRDAGVGLSPQSLDSLFDAFHTTKSGGMGIGLFVSRSIIERHNGRLWAEPNYGVPGATFSFSIPRGAEHGRDTVSASSAS
jgi:signal transduction histidine kinase